MENEIEIVARALYAAEDDAQVWEREPEILKEEFRCYARTALRLLAEHRGDNRPQETFASVPYAA
jgi:hypothetical protein